MGKTSSRPANSSSPPPVTGRDDIEHLNMGLRAAADQGMLSDLLRYLQDGADVNSVDPNGVTALMAAAVFGHLEVVNLLLEKGSNVNHATERGWTALIHAAVRGHLEVVNLLLEKGGDVNHAEYKRGWTALIHAAVRGHLEVVNLLLERGANVNHANKYGSTALFHAALRGHLEVVNLLLEKGANVDHADEDGKTAEQLALDHGHTRVAQILKEARLAKAVKEISSTQREGTPIKLFALGKAYAGKTEILKSLFCTYEGYQSVYQDTEGYNREKIKEKYETRTIGINVYHVKVEEQRLSIFDCGGLDNYYMLHSLFTKVDNSIILVVFSLTRNDGSPKGKEEIKAELKQQIAFIKSKSACKCDDNVLLIGTHKDLLSEDQVETFGVMLDQISSVLEKEEGFKFPFNRLVNATEGQNNEMKDLLKEIVSQSKAIANAQDADKRSVPSLCFSACEALKSYAEKENRMVLHWETVYQLVKEAAKESASVELQREEVFDICLLLDTFGMLLVSQPEDLSKERLKKNPDKLFAIPDLNWFFSKFLGVIFSPSGYLQDPGICKNGYVSVKDLATAFKGFNLSQEQIVAVLKEYNVVCDSKNEGELLIPGALSNEKKPEWSCCGDKYEFILGRRCENVGTPFNIGTMPEILSRMGQMWPTQSLEFFRDGVFMFCKYAVLIELTDLGKGINVLVGVLKTEMGNNPEETLKDMGKVMDTVYWKVVFGTAELKNLSSEKMTYALSCSWLLSCLPGEPMSVPFMYEIHFLEDTFLMGVEEVKHPVDRRIKDNIKFLLTWSNMEELKHHMGLRPQLKESGGDKKGMLFRELPIQVLQWLKLHLEKPTMGLGGWEEFASHFKEVKDEVSHIQAKANNSELAEKLLFDIRRFFQDDLISILKSALKRMQRNDLVLMFEDDSLLDMKMKELSPVFIQKLARKFCNSDLSQSSEDMMQLAEFLDLNVDVVEFMIEDHRPPKPTDLLFRLLIDRNPNITSKEVAEVLENMKWRNLAQLLCKETFSDFSLLRK